MNLPAHRACAFCGKPLGCFAFRWIVNGKAVRGYAHPACLTRAKAKIK